MFTGIDVAAAARVTGTLWEQGSELAIGWTASIGAGANMGLGFRGPVGATPPTSGSVWFQPALNLRLPCLFRTRLRATIAPSFRLDESNVWGLDLWKASTPAGWLVIGVAPAIELAFPVGDRHELTLGGNGLVGWRGRF